MSNSIRPLTLRNIIASNANEIAPKWSAGQLLQAVFQKKDDDGYSLLKVGNTLLQVKLKQTLNSGEKILLEVMKADTKPVVRVYTNLITSRSTQTYITEAIKQNIAKQNSAALLLNSIQLIQNKSPLYSNLPITVRRLMKKLLSQITPLKHMTTADAVKKAFQNSGLFLEQRLFKLQQESRITSALQQTLTLDLKATLLKLKQKLSAVSNALKEQSNKINPDSYQNLARNINVKPLTNTINPTSNTRKLNLFGINALNTTALLAGAGPSNSSKISIAPFGSMFGYYLQRSSVTDKLDLQPLLRNSIPHPSGSARNRLSITADKLASSSQGLILQLLKMVDSTLARINIAQLSSASVDPDNKQVWLFDIPVTRGYNEEHELIQAKIDVDKENTSDKTSKIWTVNLAMNISSLGPLQSKITICDNKVQVHFNSNNLAQKDLIEEHINTLRQSFVNAGLLVEKITFTQGLEENPASDNPRQLLDEEA